MKIIIEVQDWAGYRDTANELPVILKIVADEIENGFTKGGSSRTPIKWEIQTEEEDSDIWKINFGAS